MYIWLSATRLRQLTKYVRKCVFASVFKHLFFLNKQKAQETRSLMYVIYWELGRGPGGFPFPLDHDCGQACAS